MSALYFNWAFSFWIDQSMSNTVPVRTKFHFIPLFFASDTSCYHQNKLAHQITQTKKRSLHNIFSQNKYLNANSSYEVFFYCSRMNHKTCIWGMGCAWIMALHLKQWKFISLLFLSNENLLDAMKRKFTFEIDGVRFFISKANN